MSGPDPEVARLFGEFCRLKTQVNGPDVHMRTAIAALDDMQLVRPDALWWLGVYTTFCSVPPGAATWARWDDPALLLAVGDRFDRWVDESWAGLPVRTQRRPVRSRAKLAECVRGMARWCVGDGRHLGGLSYEDAWASVDGAVKYYGRYAIIKLLEALRRAGYAQLEAPDIRPRGAWSPRRMLAYLYPDRAEVLNSKSDSAATLAEVNAVARDALALLESELGRPSSYYELEVLLCNARQSLYSGTLYVGRTIDSELEYYEKCRRRFSDPTAGRFDFFKMRRRTFPPECLGELQGWTGVRRELKTYRGYVWSDLRYDWHKTLASGDFDNPVRRT